MSLSLQSDAGFRFASFVTIFVIMAAWELAAPRRALTIKRPWRWTSNLGILFLNGLLMRLIAPLGAAGIAVAVEESGWGLFHWIALPPWAAFALSIVILDLAVYLQHVVFHAVPLFWRLHIVHHADLDFDVTTGGRFHTIEIVLSFGIKAGVIALLGAPAVAVLIFEVLLNATSMFNHSNVRMPTRLDRWLRLVVVTPDMHRVHHSWERQETDSNFGFNFPWWDRMFRTYRDQPREGHREMTIGLKQIRDESRAERPLSMLVMPFTANPDDR
jgi:sterol desaturase/sphingolipid hydroxylase (fatty acid hydroxylase superfamily)